MNRAKVISIFAVVVSPTISEAKCLPEASSFPYCYIESEVLPALNDLGVAATEIIQLETVIGLDKEKRPAVLEQFSITVAGSDLEALRPLLAESNPDMAKLVEASNQGLKWAACTGNEWGRSTIDAFVAAGASYYYSVSLAGIPELTSLHFAHPLLEGQVTCSR